MTAQLWNPRERLTPWALFDLERLAWVVEQRSNELAPEERRLIHAVAARLDSAAGSYERHSGP